MKLLFTKGEFKEIKNIVENMGEFLYHFGELNAKELEQTKELSKILKDNVIVKYKFFTSSFTIEINPYLIEDLLREYGDLVVKIMPLMASLVPSVKAIMAMCNMSAKNFESIINKHMNDDRFLKHTEVDTVIENTVQVEQF